MPSFASRPSAVVLSASHTLYANARDDAEVFAVLSAEPWGFTAGDFDAGLALIGTITDADTAEIKEELESQRATAAANADADAVEKTYSRHRVQLRRHYRRGTPEYGALGLAGSAPDARPALLKAARDFYNARAADPAVLDPIRGLTPAVIADAQALVKAATDSHAAQAKEAGDVDVVSDTRQTAVTALRTHAAVTAADATVALADHPQFRERLGLLERS